MQRGRIRLPQDNLLESSLGTCSSGCWIKVSRDGILNECRDDIEVLRSSSGWRWMEGGLGGREEGEGTM